MSTPPKFAFFLKQSANVYYYQDSNGLIQTVSSPGNIYNYSLQYEPANWREVRITWGRDGEKLGVFRSMSEAMEFTYDGADICRKIFGEQGFAGYLEFEIHIRDDQSWFYAPMFKGLVNFKDQIDDDLITFKAKIIEGGIYAILDNKSGTDFTVPIIRAAATQVVVDGPELLSGSKFTSISRVDTDQRPGYYFGYELAPTITEGEYSAGQSKDSKYLEYSTSNTGATPNFPVDSAEHNNYIYKATIAQKITLKFATEFQYNNIFTPSSNQYAEVHVFVTTETNGNPYQDIKVYDDSATPNPPGTNRRVILNVTSPEITLNEGDRVYVAVYIHDYRASPGGLNYGVIYYGNGTIAIQSKFRIAATPTEGYRYHEALTLLIQQMSGSTASLSSSFLTSPSNNVVDSKPYQVLLTSPFALKGVYTTSTGAAYTPFLRLNFDAMVQDMTGRWPVGIGVNSSGNILVEDYATFFNDGLLSGDLGELAELHLSAAEEFIFTQFKTGQTTQTYDDLNGLDEFNKENTYVMPLDNIDFSERIFTSPYRRDMYGIEQARLKGADYASADSSNDGAVFMLDIDTSTSTITTTRRPITSFTGFKLRRPNNPSNTSGVLSPDWSYNISLSPARDAIRLGRLLHSVLYKQNGKQIKYNLTDKNNELVSNIGSGVVTEKANIDVTTLGNILFQPVIFSCRVNVPLTITAIMQTKPYGVFTATYKGKTIRGFVMDVSCKPGDNEAQEWRLLASPTCDLSQFYPH